MSKYDFKYLLQENGWLENVTVETDDNGKPKNIILSEFVHQNFKSFLNDYKTQNISDTWEPPNVVFQDINIGERRDEIDDLVEQGWEILQ